MTDESNDQSNRVDYSANGTYHAFWRGRVVYENGMSIPEAAQLVLQAGLMGGKDGSGEIFVLDMGEPVKIADLAKDLIRLSGLSEADIRIVYNGFVQEKNSMKNYWRTTRTLYLHLIPNYA